MSNTHNQNIRRHPNQRSSRRPELLMATGALLGAAALLGGTAKGRDIVSDAYHPTKQPVKTQKFDNVGPNGAIVYEKIGDGASTQPDPTVVLKFDRQEDGGLFGFADRHLQGDPTSHLEELHGQLPEGTPEGSYDVPDNWKFEVKASELDDPADDQIVGIASVDD